MIDYEDDIVYVDFGNGKIYTYNKSSLTLFRNPVLIVVKTNFGILNNIAKILKFDSYYKIFFNNGTNKVYSERDLFIENNLLKNPRVMELFNYFSETTIFLCNPSPILIVFTLLLSCNFV